MRNIYKEIRNFPFILYLLFIQINIENTNRTDLVFFSTLETVFTFILFKMFHFLYFSSVYQSFKCEDRIFKLNLSIVFNT